MGNEFITFGILKLHGYKSLIFWKNVEIDNVLVSSKISSDKKNL